MEFRFTEEQLALKESARKFAEKEIAPRSRQMDAEGRFDWEAWRKAGELGLLGLPIPLKYGGGGLSPLDTALAMEGIGLGSRDVGFLTSVGAHVVICEIPIWEWGTEAQRQKYLPRLCKGEWIGACAITEPNAGSDVASITTRARRDDARYVLNGTKIFITNAPIADVVLVFATIDPKLGPKGITAFLVEKGSPGFRAGSEHDKMGLRSSPTGELIFEDCEVPVENRLGEEGQGFQVVLSTLEWERACIISGVIGCAEARLDDTVRYAQQRVQFGQPIAEFQAIQHKLADMKVNLEVARLMVYKVAWMKQEGIPAVVEGAIAKLFLTESNLQSSIHGFAIFGGYGYMKDYDIERDVRDTLPGRFGAGTSEIQRNIIARALLKNK